MKKLYIFILFLCLFCFIISRSEEEQEIRDLKILQRICFTFRNENKSIIKAILHVVSNRSSVAFNSIEEEGRYEMFFAYSGKMDEGREKKECEEIAKQILSGSDKDITKGSTYFSNKNNIPKAFKGMVPTYTAGTYVLWKIQYP